MVAPQQLAPSVLVCLVLSALVFPLVQFVPSVLVCIALSALVFPLVLFPPLACLSFHIPIRLQSRI